MTLRLLHAVRPLRLIRPRRQFAQTESRHFTSPSAPKPWFIDSEDSETAAIFEHSPPPHLPEPPNELPANIPEPIRVLYNKLLTSPFLEPSTLVAREPLRIPPGPSRPARKPKGRRRIRGVTYAGESTLEASGGIWNWVVMAQVCELDQFCYHYVCNCCIISGQGGYGKSRFDRISRACGS